MLKIVLSDDHALFRHGMREILLRQWPELTLLETATYDHTMDMLHRHRDIDLMLLDLSMPGSDYRQGIKAIRACKPRTPLIVISARQSREVIQSVLALGTNGYIPKSSDSREMLGAIDLVLKGGTFIPQQLVGESAKDSGAAALTDRQRQVLVLLAEGRCNKDISRQLGICERTVKMHVSTLMEKLGAENRTQLAIMAVSEQI